MEEYFKALRSALAHPFFNTYTLWLLRGLTVADKESNASVGQCCCTWGYWSICRALELGPNLTSHKKINRYISKSFKTWLYTNQFHNFPHSCYRRKLNFLVTCFLILFYFFLFSLSVSWERNNISNLLFPPVILVSRWFSPTNLLFSCTWKQLVSLQSIVNFNV